MPSPILNPCDTGRRGMEVFYEDDGDLQRRRERVSKESLAALVSSGLCVSFDEVGLFASPLDNVGVAKVTLPKGLKVRIEAKGRHKSSQPKQYLLTIQDEVLQGHRFAVQTINKGQPLKSWERSFGLALRDIQAGEWVRNSKACQSLRERDMLDDQTEANFDDFIEPLNLDAVTCKDSTQRQRTTQKKDTFWGFERPAPRGSGTRNFVIVMGTTNHTAAIAREVAREVEKLLSHTLDIDGVVPVAHTESGSGNNAELLKRTLAGMLVHANVAGAVVLSHAEDGLTGEELRQYMVESADSERYMFKAKLEGTPHLFFSLSGESFHADIDRAVTMAKEKLLPEVARIRRSRRPVSELCVALQCGGSDAFSGITANPLVGQVAKRFIEQGGSAVLAETDELIGAESYILQHVRSMQVAQDFLEMTERIKELLSWHGVSAEGNPSGGNLLRGLYNITIKSLGAATKKAPDVSLDGVLDYAEPVPREEGYYFMHSPGNDLESVAGQVASGCNVIFFTTGNGSVTNFPFVPTIKIVSTTERFELLRNDMDFDAGRLFDTPHSMHLLARDLYQLTLSVASGKKSVGEQAGHSQVSIWRDWRQTGKSSVETFCSWYPRSCVAPRRLEDLLVCQEQVDIELLPSFISSQDKIVREGHIGLVLPTSLCSSEVARLLAEKLEESLGGMCVFDKFVALPHSEGCGSNYGNRSFGHDLDFPKEAGMEILDRLLFGHLMHPHVRGGILLEHGCEMNHNVRMVARAKQFGLPPEAFIQASVQLDGGIQSVIEKCVHQVRGRSWESSQQRRVRLRVGLLDYPGKLSDPCTDERFDELFQTAIRHLIKSGNNVVVMQDDPLLRSLLPSSEASLRFGESIVPHDIAGLLFVMESLSSDWVERVSAMGSAGVDVILVHNRSERYLSGHPFVPVLSVGAHRKCNDMCEADVQTLFALLSQTACGINTVPSRVNHHFQVTRGPIGVSV